MAEYIDRNAVINAISREMDMQDLYLPVHFLDVLNDVPAADVVEVVRCNDCAIPHNRWTGCPRMNGTIMRPDDYCSYGERKEDE